MKAVADVIREARRLIGTPYLHQQRVPGVGVDCIGLAVLIGRALDLGVGDYKGYGPIPNNGEFERVIEERLLRANPVPGTVLLFRSLTSRQAAHCGLLTDNGNLVHAFSKLGRVVEHVYAGFWPKLLISAWAFPGVDYPAGTLALCCLDCQRTGGSCGG